MEDKIRRKKLEKVLGTCYGGKESRVIILVCRLVMLLMLIAQVIFDILHTESLNNTRWGFLITYLYLCWFFEGEFYRTKAIKKTSIFNRKKASFSFIGCNKREGQNEFIETLQVLPIKKSDVDILNIQSWYITNIICTVGFVFLNTVVQFSNVYNGIIGIIGLVNLIFVIVTLLKYLYQYSERYKMHVYFLYMIFLVFSTGLMIFANSFEASNKVFIKILDRLCVFKYMTGYIAILLWLFTIVILIILQRKKQKLIDSTGWDD